MVAMATEMKQYYQLWYQMFRNKILGKVTKFDQKMDKNSRSGEQIYGRGHIGLRHPHR